MSGSAWQIPLGVQPINPFIGAKQLLENQTSEANIGLIGQQAEEAGARATQLIPAQAALVGAQAGAVPSEINLRGAQAGLATAQTAAVPSEIAQRYATAGNLNANSAETMQNMYGKYLQNYGSYGPAAIGGGALGLNAPPMPPLPSYSGSPTAAHPISEVVPPQLTQPFPQRVGFDPQNPANEKALAQIKDPALRQQFLTAAQQEDVPLPWLVSLAAQESGINPNAPRGSSGEYGIMQIMPATGRTVGFTEQQLQDPGTNIRAGARYYRSLLNQVNNPLVAGAAYNTGSPGTAVPAYVLGRPNGAPGLLGHFGHISGIGPENAAAAVPGGAQPQPGAPQPGAPQPGGGAPLQPGGPPVTRDANGLPAQPALAPGAPPPGAAPPGAEGNGPPAGLTANRPIMIPGMPGPTPALMAAGPGGLTGSPEQREQFQRQRANTMASVFSSQSDPAAGVDALFNQGFLSPTQRDDLLAHPDNARNFIAQQMPVKDQPTPGVQSQILRDNPLIGSDLVKNEANVDTAMRAATDQFNLKNIKTLVEGTPDDLMGAAAQTRLAIQKYATEFGGHWSQELMSKLTGVKPLDVSTLQDLQKAFLSNVMSNERTQGVQRIGAMSTAYFAKASPSIDMTKPAVQQIVNWGLVAQQMSRDFGDASNNAYASNRKTTNDSLVNGPYHQYEPLSDTVEKEWLAPKSTHSPDVYAAAANLMNGVVPSKAFKNLSEDQQVEALRIIQRTDPNAIAGVVALKGK